MDISQIDDFPASLLIIEYNHIDVDTIYVYTFPTEKSEEAPPTNTYPTDLHTSDKRVLDKR